jgi:hypothetical protein
MAFSLVASAEGATDGNSATTGAFNATGATLLIATVSSYGGGGSSNTLSDTEGNLGWVERALYGNGGIRVQLFDCNLPSTGASMTVTYTASSSFASVQVTAWTGNDLSAPFDQENGSVTTASTIQPGALTPPAAGSLFISGLAHESNGGATPTINSGFTIAATTPYAGGNNEGGSIAYFVQGAAASLNPTWDITNSADIAAVLGTYLAATGGGGTTWPGYISPFGYR